MLKCAIFDELGRRREDKKRVSEGWDETSNTSIDGDTVWFPTAKHVESRTKVPALPTDYRAGGTPAPWSVSWGPTPPPTASKDATAYM